MGKAGLSLLMTAPLQNSNYLIDVMAQLLASSKDELWFHY